MEEPIELAGVVIIPASSPSFQSANLRIMLQDVTEADASSKLLAEIQMDVKNHQMGDASEFEFRFEVANLKANSSYSLNAHLDMQNGREGEVKKGDLITTQSYPVSVFDRQATYRLYLRQI